MVRELVDSDGISRIVVGGFSMGGNLALKMAGEMGEDPPPALLGVCAVSPALDLKATVENLERSPNRPYQWVFARGLRGLVERKSRLYPKLYDTRRLERLRTVRDYDEMYTALHGGFADAEDYYARASASSFVARIRVPSLIVHARDDPLVPFDSLPRPQDLANPNIAMATPKRGGHVAFVSAEREGRFWAEELLAQVCHRLSGDAQR